MEIGQLYFSPEVSKDKPENIISNKDKCPFCDVDSLEEIIEKQGDIIWLKNKYPTLQNTFQTVIIESSDCEESISTYSNEYMRKLMRFAISKWLDWNENAEYQSVILFKNHGPLSGGSIKHSHMQIVGLKDVDYTKNIVIENFNGISIIKHDGLELTISQQPIIGFSEFNIVLDDINQIDLFSDYIQVVVKYVLTNFHRGCSSYNIFFYYIENKIICKIIPRFIVSPYFVGYKIPQVPIESRLLEIKQQLINNIMSFFAV